ncbi:hypothetical protein RND81_05G039900 [Saponaria officinalis]|uniref:Uncharacterized protein n=1 Tax=Saponaria officinalis TaxID=3572 RepID=A0AAW1KT29_SAPOF
MSGLYLRVATTMNINDLRQPSAAKPYKPSLVTPQDLPVDYAGFIAVLCGVLGAMFQVYPSPFSFFTFFPLHFLIIFLSILMMIVIYDCIIDYSSYFNNSIE